MSQEIKRKKIKHRGKTYQIESIRRPFRENLEIRVQVGKQILTISEMGYGERALISKLRAELDKLA